MQQVVDRGRRYTVDEFVAAFEGTEGKVELVDGLPVWIFRPTAPPGEAVNNELAIHVVAKFNLALALRDAIRGEGLPLVALSDGMSVLTGPASTRAPDAVVITRADFDPDVRILERPVLLCEVLSPSTRRTDTGVKIAEYFALPSVTHYLILDPLARMATLVCRAGDGVATRIVTDGDIVIDGLGGATIAIPLAPLFEV